jgi:ATP-dependent RNA helicase CshB
MDSFQELALPAFLHEALKTMHFEKPTAVQAQAIPPALEGKDLIAPPRLGRARRPLRHSPPDVPHEQQQ